MKAFELPTVELRSRDQRYAASAYRQARAIPLDLREHYASMAHKLPALIRTAGLAQALAYVEARGGKAGQALLNDLATTIEAGSSNGLLNHSRNAELREYLQISRRALAALDWYKRFTFDWVDQTEVTTAQEAP